MLKTLAAMAFGTLVLAAVARPQRKLTNSNKSAEPKPWPYPKTPMEELDQEMLQKLRKTRAGSITHVTLAEPPDSAKLKAVVAAFKETKSIPGDIGYMHMSDDLWNDLIADPQLDFEVHRND